MNPDLELAWAAGFFDGEGSIYRDSRGSVRLSANQIRPEPLHRFVQAVGVGRVYGPYGPKQVHQIQLVGEKAHQVIDRLLPLLSPPKREQIERVLSPVVGELAATAA